MSYRCKWILTSFVNWQYPASGHDVILVQYEQWIIIIHIDIRKNCYKFNDTKLFKRKEKPHEYLNENLQQIRVIDNNDYNCNLSSWMSNTFCQFTFLVLYRTIFWLIKLLNYWRNIGSKCIVGWWRLQLKWSTLKSFHRIKVVKSNSMRLIHLKESSLKITRLQINQCREKKIKHRLRLSILSCLKALKAPEKTNKSPMIRRLFAPSKVAKTSGTF